MGLYIRWEGMQVFPYKPYKEPLILEILHFLTIISGGRMDRKNNPKP